MPTFWIAMFTTLFVVAGLLVLPFMVSLTRKQIAARKPTGALVAPEAQPVTETTPPVAPVAPPIVVEAPTPAPKSPGYLSKVWGKINPFTLFGILVFTTILIIFMLIPGDLVAYIGTILMLTLVAMIVISIAMLVTGLGSKLLWGILLVGFVLLAFNPPQTTAEKVAETTATITKEGLKGVTPDLVPDFVKLTPAQREAARKEAAERLAAEDKARREEELHQAKVRGIETAAYEAEVEKNKPLTAAAFTTKTIGVFEPFTVKSETETGPINLYKGTCPYWYKSGMGMIEIYSRPDTTSEPVLAELTENYAIKSWGHDGPAHQMFFKAVQGDIKIELERRQGGDSCK